MTRIDKARLDAMTFEQVVEDIRKQMAFRPVMGAALTHKMAQTLLAGITNDPSDEVKRLTRELDAAMHGEEGAAKQASLCDLIPLAKNLRVNAERWQALKELAGSYQDGSDTTVKLYQDDATRSCFIEVGKKIYGTDGSSFNSAMDEAIKENKS